MATDLMAALRTWRRPPNLTTCSVCLRVLSGSEWLDAEHVIRQIRSYELDDPPRLGGGLCDKCAESIVRARLYPEGSIAA